jgi:hypothetical protein
VLQSDLSLVANYGRAAESLAGAKKQLGLLNQARESLRSLSGPAREEMASILNGLAVQAGKLSREERSHQDAEENLRKPAAEASNQALPDLPDDIRGLVREVNEEADTSNPSRPHHGQDRGSPWADRPPSPPQRPPGKSNRTGAPPHPHSPSPSANDEPSTPADHGKAPVRHEPSTPSKPAPPAPADPAPQKPQAPARPATPSGGGSQFSVDTGSGGGDSGSVASDASDSSDSDGVASDASDSGGSDAGSDAGSDGSDGGDGGGDGGGGDGGE